MAKIAMRVPRLACINMCTARGLVAWAKFREGRENVDWVGVGPQR